MDDLISRQAAIEAVRTMQTYKLFEGEDMILVDKAEVQTMLMLLPKTEPKTGKWMPIEEALEILDRLPTIGEQVDALEMAIGALEKQMRNLRTGNRLE